MASSYRGLKKHYEALPIPTKRFLGKLDLLLSNGGQLDVALAYTFMKLEEGNHRALKCGLVRIHDCNSHKVDDALAKQHFTRTYFQTVFKNVIGRDLPAQAIQQLHTAERVRDRLIHGKSVEPSDLRTAILGALDYIKLVGSFVEIRTEKNPFGDLRGLVGRKEPLSPTSSYWILKGIGLYTKGPEEPKAQ